MEFLFQGREFPMTGDQVAWEVALLLLGGTGLFEGLVRLSKAPLEAVLIILSAMFFLLFPAASLSGAAVRYTDLRRKWKSTYTPRGRVRLHYKEKMNVRSKRKR
jgi:hypothetical protein